MRVNMSSYLCKEKPVLKELVNRLSKDFAYVSVLGTDVVGKSYGVQKTGKTLSDSMWTERGFVVRIHNGINYSEFSFNEICEENMDSLINKIKSALQSQIESMGSMKENINNYPIIEEEEIVDNFYGEVEKLPEGITTKEKIEKMNEIKDKGIALSKLLINFRVTYEEVYISKVFISNKKELEQSYIFSQGYLVALVRRDEKTKYAYETFSGLKGVELLDEMEKSIEGIIEKTVRLLDAESIIPGEYEVICPPEISGLIAHEAFGHGVEMDMFVKNRAKALEYLEKPVASELVTMHDGATAAKHVSSYLFDDEGVIGTDTVVIDKGILKTGISDILSALKLGTKPTGNGKRQSFERKAYARMTNTFFAPGSDDLEDMIASIKYGYILRDGMSGMEDPKNWGIQCSVLYGEEIRDGKLTGKIVSPVILTGYVPDLLKSISMVSKEVELSGSGACGKGYKELVKVSAGGPYIKARVRLG